MATPLEASATTIVVNTASDTVSDCATTGAGTCSLRDAIIFANRTPGTDAIAFSIGSGAQTIRPVSPLPAITDPVAIQGWTQPGSEQVRIELDGSLAGAGADGLQIRSASSGVSALSIYGFAGNAILIEGGANNIVSGCFLGVDHTATLVRGNGGAGVLISGSEGNSIGYIQQLRNVIAGNRDGVRIEGAGSNDNILLGNLFGVNYDFASIGNTGSGIVVRAGRRTIIVENSIYGSGDTGITLGPGSAGSRVEDNGIGGYQGPNAGDGILIDGSSANLIGGDHYLSTANAILQNGGSGIHIINGADGNLVAGNTIGTDELRFPQGNRGAGILVEDSNTNTIGGAAPAGNLIAFNEGPGISVTGDSIGNTITQNTIFSNGGLGIDLGGDGVTPNQVGMTRPGPNRLQNYPSLTRVYMSRISITLEGAFDGAPGQSFTVEFFASPTCHALPPNDFGEGRAFLGSTRVNTNGSTGTANFSATFALPAVDYDGPVFPGSLIGRSITATATDENGNTSEFSKCYAATPDLVEPPRPQPRHLDPRKGVS